MAKRPPRAVAGRGARSNPDNRFDAWQRELVDDGWGSLDAEPPRLATELLRDASRRILTFNDSPDVGFDRSINPYKGCEHGCVYCFARPTHAYLGLSPGLDFESRIAYKPEAAALLRGELCRRGYRPAPVALGINTDAYQPVERRLGITRQVLEVLYEARHPVVIVTKSALVERDIDLLAPMAAQGLVQVALSITTLDRALARVMEPRAAAPQRRLETLRALTAARIPAGVLAAPLIPVLTDGELENLLAAAREAGAVSAGYVLLRLPHELKEMFVEWLQEHRPLQAGHVMARLRESRGGRDYDSRFGHRMRGTGTYADLIAQRFRIAVRRLGFGDPPELACDRFRPPAGPDGQLGLF